MKRVCIYWLMLFSFVGIPAQADEWDNIRSDFIASTGGPGDKIKIESLQKQVNDLQKELNALLAKQAEERAAWKKLTSQPVKESEKPVAGQSIGYHTVTVYETQTRTVWEYCPWCPYNPWQARTVTERVPVKKQVEVYQPASGYMQPGVYEHNGRKYFWDGKESTWLSSHEFFQEDPSVFYYQEPAYSYRPVGGFNYSNTGRFVRDDGTPNGPIVAPAKASIIIPLKILGCVLRTF